MSRRCVYYGLEIVFQLRLKIGKIWFSARKNSTNESNNNNNNKEIDSSYPFLSRFHTNRANIHLSVRAREKKVTQ